MTKLEFYIDFASPNAYYSYRAIPEILQRTGAELEIKPVLLGGLFKITGNQPPMAAFGGVKGKLDYEMLESKRFMEKHQLTAFKFNSSFPMNTIMVMRGLLAAQELGVEAQYVEVVLAAMWEQDLKMDDPEVVLSSLNTGGLDGARIMEMIQNDAIKEQLKENTQAATDRGIFGVPTFFVGSEMFFGKERLGQVEEALGK